MVVSCLEKQKLQDKIPVYIMQNIFSNIRKGSLVNNMLKKAQGKAGKRLLEWV